MNKNHHIRFSFTLVIITLISILGGYIIYQATQWGPWAFSDSAAYLSAARNFNAGKGLIIINSNGTTTHLTEFAPLYPILISLFRGNSGNYIQVARWMDIISFSAGIFMIGYLVFFVSKRFIPTLFTSIFFTFSPIILDAFSGLMSEAVFILLLIMQIFLLVIYHHESKFHILVFLVIVSVLLPLVRYAGIVFTISAGISLIVFRKNSIKKGLIKVFTFLIISLLPISIWFLNLYINLNKIGGKRFLFDFSILGSIFISLEEEYQVLKNWFPYYGIYPNNFVNLVIEVLFSALVIIILVLGFFDSWKSGKKQTKNHFLFLNCTIFLAAYVGFIAITHSITIPQIDIVDRMMSPALPIILLISASIFSIFFYKKPYKLLYILVIALFIIAARFNLLITLTKVNDYSSTGFGFLSREIQESIFLKQIYQLPLEEPMISNSAAFVLFHTNRYPLGITQFHNRPYGSGNAYGEKTFREKKAPLIILLPDFYNTYGDNADLLLSTVTEGLDLSFSDAIGRIYYYPD